MYESRELTLGLYLTETAQTKHTKAELRSRKHAFHQLMDPFVLPSFNVLSLILQDTLCSVSTVYDATLTQRVSIVHLVKTDISTLTNINNLYFLFVQSYDVSVYDWFHSACMFSYL